MKGKNTVFIVLAVIIVIVLGIIIGKNIMIQNDNNASNEINTIENQVNENTSKNNDSEENTTNEINTTEQEANNEIENTNTVIGKEEQESNKENSEQNAQENTMSDDELAIDLAKKEWGLDEESFKFNIEHKEGKIYNISVRDLNGNAMAWYKVDLQTGAVTQ